LFLQETPKTKFAFTFNGQLRTMNMLTNFDVKKMELTTDGNGLHYALVCTSRPKRVNQLIYCIREWNTQQPSKIHLQAMPGCSVIVTFTKSESPRKHFIVRRIFADRDNAASELESMYRFWVVEFSNTEFHLLLPQSQRGDDLYNNNEESYDIVKKKKVINHANLTVGSDITGILLGEEAEYFYNFSDAVMGALKTLCTFEATISDHEIKWMQQDLQCNANTRIGYSYAAINMCFGDPAPIKMGATMKDSPFHRLKELSSCLPQSFELLACVPSTDPFAVERLVHAHFAEFRIKKRSTGRNTEFFMVGKEVVCEFFAKLNQELLLPA
jgi:hypothetical protein